MRPALSLALMLLVGVQQGFAADYEREERWAQEIAPAIVVGDGIICRPPRGPGYSQSSPSRRARPRAAS